MSFAIVDLAETSPDWQRWRHDGIGASEAPALMGESPWRSPQALFAAKVAPLRWHAERAARRQLEAEARRHYARRTGLAVAPHCLVADDTPWLRASLDGIDLAARRAVEIKCGVATHAAVAASRTVPVHYVGQLQQTLAVTGFEAIDFWVWRPGKPAVLLTVARDEDYIARLRLRASAFWAAAMAARAAR